MISQMAFSVYDEKAAVFSPPFFMSTQGQAIRMFGDLVNDKQSSLSKHPADYRLFCLGEFDQSSGELKGVMPPKFMCAAADFINARMEVPADA